MIRIASPDDWAKLRELWEEFRQSRHALRIEGDLDKLGAYFAHSLTNPAIAVMVLPRGDALMGFAIINEVDLGLGNRVAFLRAVHMKPGTRRAEALQLQKAIMVWCHSRGLRQVLGFCNIGFPLEAYERLYGIKALYTVVGKEVTL